MNCVLGRVSVPSSVSQTRAVENGFRGSSGRKRSSGGEGGGGSEDGRGVAAAATLVLGTGTARAGAAAGSVCGQRYVRSQFVLLFAWERGEKGVDEFVGGGFGGGFGESELIVTPFAVGLLVLAFELRFIAQPGGVGGAGFREGFDGAGREFGGVGVGKPGGEDGDLAGEGRFVVGADAAETPFGVGHFADEAGFGEVGGVEMLGEFEEEGLVFGDVVTGEEDGLGAETVPEIVAGGDFAPGGGDGAGGELGIGSVGRDLGGG